MANKSRLRPLKFRWRDFSGRHRGNAFLKCDPLYSLPELLIDAIKEELPQFFTPGQEVFERDLARTVNLGFFHRGGIGLPDLPTGSAPERQILVKHVARLDEMQREVMQAKGLTPAEIDEYFNAELATEAKSNKRKNAYIGWLICNKQFRGEVAELRERWEDTVTLLGHFPGWFDNFESETENLLEFRGIMYEFYLRWNLEQMITWDWPMPLQLSFGAMLLQRFPQLSPAGPVVVVPWYLLRGSKLDLRSVIDYKRKHCGPHLYEWMELGSAHTKGKGEIFFSRVALVYRHYELALRRRYSDACTNNLAALERALARFMKRDAETVKKARQELERALR